MNFYVEKGALGELECAGLGDIAGITNVNKDRFVVVMRNGLRTFDTGHLSFGGGKVVGCGFGHWQVPFAQ